MSDVNDLPEWESTVVFRAQQVVTVRAETEKEARANVEALIGRGPMMMGVDRKQPGAAVARVLSLAEALKTFIADSESVAEARYMTGHPDGILRASDARRNNWKRSRNALVEALEGAIKEIDRNAIQGSDLAGVAEDLRLVRADVKGRHR